MNESDPRSNVHYLGSSENKAWKKFRPVQDLNPWPLRYRCSALPTELTSQLGASWKRLAEKDYWQLKLKQKNAIEAKSLTPLFPLPFATCTQIVYMIDNQLNKFSSLAIQSLITLRTSGLLGAPRLQLGLRNKSSKNGRLCLHDQSSVYYCENRFYIHLS